MSALRRPDWAVLKQESLRPSGYWCRVRALALVMLLTLVPPIQAQVADARRAIEKLEGCDRQEDQKDCITILTRSPAGENKQAIKAQVRGGRIIWYEFDTKTGKVRRTN